MTHDSSRAVRWLVILALSVATTGMFLISMRANYLYGRKRLGGEHESAATPKAAGARICGYWIAHETVAGIAATSRQRPRQRPSPVSAETPASGQAPPSRGQLCRAIGRDRTEGRGR